MLFFNGDSARMRVAKMVENGFKSVFVYVCSLWILFDERVLAVLEE